MMYGESLSWQLSIADFPHHQQAQRNTISQRAQAEIPQFNRRRTALELGDRDERIRMIGAQLSSAAEREWRARNPHWLAWMDSEGVSETEAMVRWKEWSKRVSFDKTPKRTEVSRTRRKVQRGGSVDIQDHAVAK